MASRSQNERTRQLYPPGVLGKTDSVCAVRTRSHPFRLPAGFNGLDFTLCLNRRKRRFEAELIYRAVGTDKIETRAICFKAHNFAVETVRFKFFRRSAGFCRINLAVTGADGKGQ